VGHGWRFGHWGARDSLQPQVLKTWFQTGIEYGGVQVLGQRNWEGFGGARGRCLMIASFWLKEESEDNYLPIVGLKLGRARVIVAFSSIERRDESI
jgi:hypothetical protein